jgi:hypothetical protein
MESGDEQVEVFRFPNGDLLVPVQPEGPNAGPHRKGVQRLLHGSREWLEWEDWLNANDIAPPPVVPPWPT